MSSVNEKFSNIVSGKTALPENTVLIAEFEDIYTGEMICNDMRAWLIVRGICFINAHEAEYLSGNEYLMLQRLRDYLSAITVVKLEQSGIAEIAHELLLEFKSSKSGEAL